MITATDKPKVAEAMGERSKEANKDEIFIGVEGEKGVGLFFYEMNESLLGDFSIMGSIWT